MEAKEVGRIGVRALPDTTGFRKDLLEKLKGIEKRTRMQVQTVLDDSGLAKDVARAVKAVEKSAQVTIKAVLQDGGVIEQTRRAAEKAQETVNRNPVQVPVLSEMDKAFRTRITSDIRKSVAGVEALIPATVEGERLRSEINDQVQRIQDQVKAEIPVEPEKAAEFRAKIAKMVSDVQDKTAQIRVDAETAAAKQRLEDLAEEAESRTVELPVGVDAAIAAARIAALTRDRLVTIRTRLEGSSFAATAGALAGLSGARVLGNLGASVGRMVTNLDRSVPSIAGASIAIATLSATALAGVSNILTLAGSLAAIAPAALALPGIFAGAAVGVGVLIAALADAPTVLADLGPAFTSLQDSISNSFWSRAAQPIRDLTYALLPELRTGLSATAAELGAMTADVASSLQSALSGDQLATMFEHLRKSIEVARGAVDPLVQAFVTLGTVGGSYLPRLAGWLTTISGRFNDFIQGASGDGSLTRWIDAGITNLQHLGRVIANVGGILGGLSRAAAAAGGASLGALADGLARVNAAINGPVWQGALTTVFRGAHQAMEALGPGVSALGDAFVSLAPTLANIMVLASLAGSALLQGLGAALSHPTFQGGARTLFAGILQGVNALVPVFPLLGQAAGVLMATLGQMAATVGPVLAAAFAGLVPVFMSVLGAVQPIIPVLGGALISVIQFLAPLLQSAAEAVSSFTHRWPELSAVVVVVGAAVAALVPLVVSVLSALATMAPVISAVAASFTAGGTAATVLSTVMSTLGTAVRLLLGPWGLLAGLFIAAVASSAPLRESLATLAQTVFGLVTTLVGQMLPVLQQITAAILPALVAIFLAVVPVVTTVVQILTQLATMIMALLMPVIQALLPVVQTVFSVIASVVTAAVGVIQAVLSTFLAVLQGDWSAAWQGVKNIASSVWNLIVSIIQGAIQILGSVIQAGMSLISSVWSSVWSAVQSITSSVLSSVVSFITNGMSNAVAAVSSGVARVKQWFVDMGSSVVSTVTGLASSLASAGRDLIAGFIGGIASMAGAVVDKVRNVVGGAVSAAKNLLGINSPSRVFMEIGEYTGEGMAIGLDHKTRAVQASMRGLVQPPDPVLPATPTPTAPPETTGEHLTREELLAALAGLRLLVDGRELHTTVKTLEETYRGM